MSPNEDLLEKYTKGAEAAAHSLSGIAVSKGYFTDGNKELLLPFADDEGCSDVQSVSGLLCRIVGQLSYWVLTDAIPDPDKQKESADPPKVIDYQKEDIYIESAHQASGLAAAFSGTVRAGEGGDSLLNYNNENVRRMHSLLSQASESLAQLKQNKPTESDRTDALHCLLQWCENILDYATELTPEAVSVMGLDKASPRTIKRASIIRTEASPQRTGRKISWGEVNENDQQNETTPTRPTTSMGISPPPWAVPIPRPQTATPGHGSSGLSPTAPAVDTLINNSPLVPPPRAVPSPPSTSTSSLPATEQKLKHLFCQYDTEGLGWITRQDMRDIWEDMDVVGLPQYRDRLEDTLSKYSSHNGRVSYDEYCIVMLKLMSL
eukprot:TRINITY_DN15420_c0_g1_i1.p1 TRINITY_DN15420_c0_g1~~TRINITY_DN15420_c0_g1_i1.p1  ORF type:complete len:378 (+),score=88.05 TRINITY_DN15420_c0_g1_i1:87-1220(+)